jgi:hypothetical protein
LRTVIIRTLSRELRIHTESDAAARVLAYASANPQMPEEAPQRDDLTLDQSGRFFRLETPSQPPIEGSLESILAGVFGLLSKLLATEARTDPMLHAATASIGDARFVFIAEKASGKTTLILKLIEEGFAVEGDEHVVLRSGGAIPRPRRLHVKESSIALVPALASAIVASPLTTEWTGTRIFACMPSIGGRPWRIACGPIHHVVFLEPNFGGSSIMTPLTRDEAFARLMESAFMPEIERGAAAARLRMLCIGARCWRMQMGDPIMAIWHLRKVGSQG